MIMLTVDLCYDSLMMMATCVLSYIFTRFILYSYNSAA